MLSKKAIKFYELLCEATKEPVENVTLWSNEMLSNEITRLQELQKKQEVYFANKLEIEYLANMCKFPQILSAFKEAIENSDLLEKLGTCESQILEVERLLQLTNIDDNIADIEQLIEEELNNTKCNYTLIDKLEKKIDSLKVDKIQASKITINTLPNLEKRKVKIEKLIEEEKQTIEGLKSYFDVKKHRYNKQVVKKFVSFNDSLYKTLLKNKATDEQIRILKNLHFELNGTHQNSEYIEGMTKEGAKKLISRMIAEKTEHVHSGIMFNNNFEIINSSIQQSDRIMRWETEQEDNQWIELNGYFNNKLGYEYQIEVGNITKLKDVIKYLTKQGENPLYMHKTICSIYPFSKDQLQELEIINEMQILEYDKEDILFKLKTMLVNNQITKEEIILLTKRF